MNELEFGKVSKIKGGISTNARDKTDKRVALRKYIKNELRFNLDRMSQDLIWIE